MLKCKSCNRVIYSFQLEPFESKIEDIFTKSHHMQLDETLAKFLSKNKIKYNVTKNNHVDFGYIHEMPEEYLLKGYDKVFHVLK